MKYFDFRNYFQQYPIVNSNDIVNKGNFQTAYNQLNNWTKKGLVIKLKKGLYILNDTDRKIDVSNLFIANQLYYPSYISLEYALSLYELIPETVINITSVSTKKTTKFKNELGLFTYQKIKTSAFRGFIQAADNNGMKYFLAESEKAVIDFIYFNLSKFDKNDKDIFETSYRFQNLQILNIKKLLFYAKLFNNKKLTKIIKNLTEVIKENK